MHFNSYNDNKYKFNCFINIIQRRTKTTQLNTSIGYNKNRIIMLSCYICSLYCKIIIPPNIRTKIIRFVFSMFLFFCVYKIRVVWFFLWRVIDVPQKNKFSERKHNS